jgi:Tfp pilus assembly PilM family ATPase
MLSAKETLGIEIGNQFLKIIHINSKPEVINWISTDIASLTDDAIAEIIRNFVKDKKIKSVDVINHIAAGNTITKNIELPATNADEIKKIIKLQAGHYSPYSADEIIIDYISLGVFREGYTRIFLMIVKRDNISRNAKIITKAGLKLTKTVLSLETMVMWYKDQAGNPLGVLHLENDSADFLVIHKGKPLFLRNIPVGMNQLVFDKEKYLPYLLEEIAHSVDAYQTEQLEPISKIIITGASAQIADSVGLIQEKHNIAVEVEDNFKDIKLSSGLAATKSAFDDISLISLAASADKFGKTDIDLTPEEVRHKASAKAKSQDTVWLSVLVVVILVLWAAMLLESILMKKRILVTLNKEHQKYSAEALELKEKQKQLQQIKKYFQRRTFALDVLTEIYEKCIVPSEDNIILSGLVFNDDKQPRAVVRGMANTNDDVLKMVDRLEKSPYFKNVKMNYSNARKETSRKSGVVDFEVTCGFEL